MGDFRGNTRVHGDIDGEPVSARDEVFAVVRAIPEGQVMTYGQIATCLGSRLSPRAVGWMLHRCPDGVPWQRVVNASGGCSTDRLPDIPVGLQRSMLEEEDVEFSTGGTIDLEEFRWHPPPVDDEAPVLEGVGPYPRSLGSTQLQGYLLGG